MSQIAELLTEPANETLLKSFEFEFFESQHIEYVLTSLGLEDRDVESIRPCSPAQLGMLAEFINSKGSLYCNRMVLEVKENIDISRLQDAWSKAMARHAMLRTGFVRLNDPRFPFAMVTYTAKYANLPWAESSNTSSEDDNHDRRRSFFEKLHLPQWQVTLRHSPANIDIEFTAMHAIYDAQSLELILSDVFHLYKGSQLSPPVPINPILGQILTAASSISSETESFWRTVGLEYQITKFPNLTPFNVRNRDLTVSSQVVSKSLTTISEKCKTLGVSLQAAGQAAYSRLLANYTGDTNVSFGVVFSGRDIQNNAEEAVFPCLVTVPFQCRVQKSNIELISSTMKTNALLVKHQFTPLSKIQTLFQQEGPLIDTLFVYQKMSRKGTEAQFWDVVDDDARVDVSYYTTFPLLSVTLLIP